MTSLPGNDKGRAASLKGKVAAVFVVAAMTATSLLLLQSSLQYAGPALQRGQPAGQPAASEGTAARAAQAATAVGLSRSTEAPGPASANWAPLILSSCSANMPRHFAPCLVSSASNPTVAYGEELIYPAFSIPQPGFLSEEHAEWWQIAAAQYAPERYVLRHDPGMRGAAVMSANRAVYTAQHGQNLVLRNVSFQGQPPNDSFGDHACMFPLVSHRGLTPLPPGEVPGLRGRAVLANTGQSYSLQHFLDRVAKILVQSEGWRQDGTTIVSGANRNYPMVVQLWQLLLQQGGQQQEAKFDSWEWSAEELVFPCRCPMVHPYFTLRLREWLQLPEPAPLDERKTVLYLSRNDTTAASGRGVTNEAAVLKAIRSVLRERNRGERLMLFDLARFTKLEDVAAFMAASVSAIVGPHGGAFYNLFFAAPDTLLLEFMPKRRLATMIWEEGTLLGLRYWQIPCDSEPPWHKIKVNPVLVKRVLREQLGVASSPSERTTPHYEWDLAQLL